MAAWHRRLCRQYWLAGGSDLTIQALNAGSITVGSSITVTAAGAGDLALVTAAGSIDIQQPISTTGALSLQTGGTGDIAVSAAITASNLTVISGGDLGLFSDLATTVGDLGLQVAGDLVIDGDLAFVSAAGAVVNLSGDTLTNVSQAAGGSTFVLSANGGDDLLAAGWLVSELNTKSLDLAGDVRMQYGFGSGFNLPDAEDLAFVPTDGVKYPDPYVDQAADAGLHTGDTLADVLTAPNLTLAWTAGSPTATSASGSTFGYKLTLGAGFSLDKPGYLVRVGADTGTLTVRPRQLVAKPDDLGDKTYGFGNPGKYLYQITGFQNLDTLVSLGIAGEAIVTSEYDAGVAANRGVGEYDILINIAPLSKGSDPAGNYVLKGQKGVLTIIPASLTLTADDLSREYGDANPALTISAEGLQFDDTLAGSYSGALSISTLADAFTDAGEAVIDLSAGTADFANYDVILVDGTLTITKAPLAITINDGTRAYGDTNAAITWDTGDTYVMTGFKNGETEGLLRFLGELSGTVLINTSADQTSGVGDYTVTPISTTLTATNYEFTELNPGTLTITPRGLTVSAAPTREYGLENTPANITWNTTITGWVNGDTQAVLVTGEPAIIGAPASTANAGAYPVTLSQGTLSAGPNYDLTSPATTYNAATFTVSKATSLRFVADDKSRDYGDANPALTYTVTGFRNGDTSAVLGGAPSLTTTANQLTPAGTATISIGTGTLTASNYTVNLPVNFTNGTLTIDKATLQVATASTSRPYGDANPDFGAVISGYKNGQNLASSGVTGNPSLTTSATATSDVGAYPIVAAIGSLAAANYDFELLDGTLTVTKAPLSIQAGNGSRTYGTADDWSAATYAITGFKNGETEAALRDTGYLTGAPAFGTDALIGSPVAANAYLVTIAQGTLSATNYDFALSSYQNGVYAITKATLTVTASDKSREYGDPNPALEYTLSGFKLGHTTLGDIGAIGLPVLETVVVPRTGIGSYDVTVDVSGLSAANYDFEGKTGTLTITRAPLTLKVDDATTEYGSDFTGFSLTMTGFKNGETQAGLRTLGALSGDAVYTYSNAEVKLLDVSGSPYSVAVTGVGTLVADNYSFVTQTPPAGLGSLTITRAPLTLSATKITRTYGDAWTQAQVDGAWDIVGLKNGQTRDGLLASGAVSGAAAVTSANALDALVGAGTYTGAVTATNGSFAVSPTGNYAFDGLTTPPSADLVVDKAVLTVGVLGSPLTKLYGAVMPLLEPEFTGFKNSQVLATSGVTGAPVLSTTATASSNVGSYTVSVDVSGLSAANYTFSAANGTLDITKAPLTVSADPKTRQYGLSNPTLTATLTGFVLGQNLATSGVTGSAALSTAALATSGIGDYPITVSLGTLASSNYEFLTFNDSTLTITRAPLTITADPKTKVYGDANPALTYTVNGLRQSDTAAVILGGTPTVSTTVTQLTGAGVYSGAITADITGLSADNYTIGAAAGTFTVQKATLTGKVDDATRSYGYPNPAFTVTWTGYKNADTAATSGFTGELVFSTEANPASPVAGSPYAVSATVGTYSSPNYAFGTIAPGILTVDRGNLWENEVYNLAAAPLAAALRLEDIQSRLRGMPLSRDPQATIDFDKFSVRLNITPPASEKDKPKPSAPAPATVSKN